MRRSFVMLLILALLLLAGALAPMLKSDPGHVLVRHLVMAHAGRDRP
jgi:hypothetical protein